MLLKRQALELCGTTYGTTALWHKLDKANVVFEDFKMLLKRQHLCCASCPKELRMASMLLHHMQSHAVAGNGIRILVRFPDVCVLFRDCVRSEKVVV